MSWLRRCALSDLSAGAIAGLIKGHNANREVRVWESNLRTYPAMPMSAKVSCYLEKCHAAMLPLPITCSGAIAYPLRPFIPSDALS